MRLADGLWVRLVDVGAALSARGYASGERVVFDVNDAFCPWNTGRWLLEDGVASRTEEAADPRIVDPDIRRMLLTCKALAEGGRMLALHAATLVDVLERSKDEAQRKEADVLLGFLTPIVKGLLTESGPSASPTNPPHGP